MTPHDRPPSDPYRAIAPTYSLTRREDPRIRGQIHQALGDAESIVNVGAGAGAYEPRDRRVLAVEPSSSMIAQRPPGRARAIKAYAENLPLPANSVDAAMACLTLHHWSDWRIGVQELRRVARKRIVIFTFDPAWIDRFWLARDYLPELGKLDGERFPSLAEQCAAAGEEVQVQPVPIPHDCHDGFMAAYWRRPHAYLDQRVRASISTFHLPGAQRLLGGLSRLADDLASGRWQARHGDLLQREAIDLGYRLIVVELWVKQALTAGLATQP